jgi:SET domain-containing protein
MREMNEFSFILGPSSIIDAGIGVFATRDIATGSRLDLFPPGYISRRRHESEIDLQFIKYCDAEEDGYWRTPDDFSRMEVGWYLNHSFEPNATCKEADEFYALRDIAAGDEVLIDYNELNEPEDKKDAFYKRGKRNLVASTRREGRDYHGSSQGRF